MRREARKFHEPESRAPSTGDLHRTNPEASQGLGRQISDDYKGQTVQMLAVLENAFMFQADLVRALDVPVVCQFIKPKYTRPESGAAHDVMEIFFSQEPDIKGQHILLVEGLVHSG